ncbi:MAG TPA: winged helix-turn-helix domain-containing protein, partial [Streptosporangiaceae bacterium]|nr:winged helix-turn-helix domain-containing protein [Streptosporangiaceae bacterium]
AVHGGDADACQALPLETDMNDAVIDRISIKHAYQQVADAIAARIEAGRYTIKLPAERDLADEFGVSYITVRHATAILRERGLIVSIHGRRTFVASALVDQA